MQASVQEEEEEEKRGRREKASSNTSARHGNLSLIDRKFLLEREYLPDFSTTVTG